MKLGSTVWQYDGTRGEVVRGPRRASPGMVWVQWSNHTKPVLWQRVALRLAERMIYDANLAPDASRKQ